MTEQHSSSEFGLGELGELVNGKRLSRRSLLKGAAAMGAAAALGPIAAACGGGDTTTQASGSASAAGTPNKGGDLMVGIVGGSAKDTADPHTGSFEPDIAIQYIMYEGLTMWDFDMNVTNLLAESIEPNADGSVWQVKLRDGMLWHDGKPVTADDVVYSMDRIVDPKDPKVGVATLTGVKLGGTTKKVDDLTVEFNLKAPNVILDEAFAERSCKIVPVGFDPKNPIGSGPFKMTEMKPGEQFKWAAFADYWDTPPFVDTLTMIEFADDTARINALKAARSRRCPSCRRARPRSSRRRMVWRSSTPRPARGVRSPCASTPSRTATCACGRRSASSSTASR